MATEQTNEREDDSPRMVELWRGGRETSAVLAEDGRDAAVKIALMVLTVGAMAIGDEVKVTRI
jgi:hypothetical protein